MAQVNCQIEIPKPSGSGSLPAEFADKLTVGQEFVLHCEGEWPLIQTEKAELRIDQADQDKLKLLSMNAVSNTKVDLIVTSYKVGEHHLKALQIVDADHSVVLSNLDFTIASVINPQEPPKEPYGPIGPLGLAWPIWYILFFLAILFAIVGRFVWAWRLRSQKRKLLAEMRLFENSLEPAAQFFQVARPIQRGLGFFKSTDLQVPEAAEWVDKLDQAYKYYLARRFEVPTLKWKKNRVLADLKKNHPVFLKQFSSELNRAWDELDRAQGDQNKLLVKDCQQILDLLRKQIDQFETFFKPKGDA